MSYQQIETNFKSATNSPLLPRKNRIFSPDIVAMSEPASPNIIAKKMKIKKAKQTDRSNDFTPQFDIYNFIDYVVSKKQKCQDLKHQTTEIKTFIKSQEEQIESQKMFISGLKAKIKSLKEVNNSVEVVMQAQQQSMQKEISLAIAQTTSLQTEIQSYHATIKKQEYLQALIAATTFDHQNQLDLQLENNNKLVELNNKYKIQLQQLSQKIKQSLQKQNTISEKREKLGVERILSFSSKMIRQDLNKTVTETMKPSKHNKESVMNMIHSLHQKMEIIKKGLLEFYDNTKFLNKMSECNLIMSSSTKKQIETINNSQQGIVFSIYKDDLEKKAEVVELEINEALEFSHYKDLRSEQQLESIRQKNTEVLYYLKKLQTEEKKKRIVISNLEKQLAEAKTKQK